MRNTHLVLIVGAAIVASLVVMVRPSGNEVNAQSGMSKAVAECILDNLENAHSDKGANTLIAACAALHR